jgi:hypothetical protein
MGLVSNSGTTKHWISRTGVWDSTDSWSDHIIPVTGDNLVFSGQRSKFPVIQGPAPDCPFYNSVSVRSDYSGNWGAFGNFIGFMVDDFVWEGSGDCFFKAGNSSQFGGTGNIESVVIKSKRGTFYIDTEQSSPTENNNYIHNLIVSSGNLTITGGYIYFLQIAPERFQDAKVIIEGNPDTDFEWPIYMSDGLVECYAGNISTLNVSGGKWIHWGTETLTTLDISGGTVVYNTENTIAYAFISNGILDLTRTDTKKTITNAYRHPRGKVIYVPGRDAITFIDMLGEEIR